MKQSFLEFRNLMARKSEMTRNEVSLFAPIIYQFEDKYFNACCLYLNEKKETELFFNEYSTTILIDTMKCTYLESLVILHNMQVFPVESCYIYNPLKVE